MCRIHSRVFWGARPKRLILLVVNTDALDDANEPIAIFPGAVHAGTENT